MVTPLILALLDAGSSKGADGAAERAGRVPRLLMMPLRNPIVLAAALGALASATGWHLPSTLGHSCEVLGGAGVPTALVTLGMSLHGRRTVGSPARRTEVALTVVIKNLLQPLIALAVGGLLLHLPSHQLLALVVCSALPTAQNVFTYAREYGLSTALARDSVMYSTLVSMGTLSLAGWLLGGR
jgi:predicted permease